MLTSVATAPLPVLPGGLELGGDTPAVIAVLLIMLGTWILEDPTSVSVGLLIHGGELPLWVGLIGVYIGLFTGDVALYAVGRVFGRRILGWGPVRRRLPADRVDAIAAWINQRGWWLVLLSRFVPGMRLPVYMAAGAVGTSAVRFAVWTAVAVLVWTPVVVLTVFVLGEGIWQPVNHLIGNRWVAFVVAVIIFVVGVRLMGLLATRDGRRTLLIWWGRMLRWEFWPTWLVYAPLVPWLIWLWIRFRGPSTITCANPHMGHGGFLRESKAAVMRGVPEPWRTPTWLIPHEDRDVARRTLAELVESGALTYPIVLKPDEGLRGAAVRVARSHEVAVEILGNAQWDLVAQPMHPGPHELGVFYMRRPGEPRGRVFSLTHKVFPIVVGDGESTLESLIWADPRLRLQRKVFHARHADQWKSVIPKGGEIPLAFAGNHCQGTMFVDGSHLLTHAFEARIDEIARSMPEFHYGRFDIRYADLDAMQSGRAFSVIEVNGASSESTNIYDPKRTWLQGQLTLARQLWWGYRIGRDCQLLGARPVPVRVLARLLWQVFWGSARLPRLSD